MGFLVDCPTKQGEDGFAENEVDRRQHEAAHYAEYNGIADGLVGVLLRAASQGDAHKGAASVADKHGDTEGNHRQRKNHSVRRVAVRAEVAGVGNKNLVNNVIERAYQQGDDTGKGVLPHELSDALRPQIRISVIHKSHLSFTK